MYHKTYIVIDKHINTIFIRVGECIIHRSYCGYVDVDLKYMQISKHFWHKYLIKRNSSHLRAHAEA